ncbi:unnamed protein product [Mytilus edulis]|uniref:Uncharacterized protein n=1 Tax=Mytilus edulis TaxID=6550 RepID=A0A8S3UVA0_MYTED|nr:unnamed protein product [Mytilus edulis]
MICLNWKIIAADLKCHFKLNSSEQKEDHSAEDAILNMITWSLYGLNYISVNVLKPILVGNQPSIEDLLKTLEKEYEIFTKEFLGSGKVSICQEDPNGSDVSLFYRPEQYREIADCTVGSCDMKDRNDWIKDLPLTEDQTLVSDIYIVRNGPLKTSSDVEIDFIVLPVANSAEETNSG